MATIQLGNTKVAGKLLSYGEKKAVERSGVNCPPEYAKAQFKATRELWGKTDGIQAHHVIQSFKPGEISPEEANRAGQDLARDLARGHEAVVYTHADQAHIHNHIVINAVNYEDGHKYQSSKKDLYRVREMSDRICQERGLSVVKEPTARERYHRAEYGLAKRGEMSWKEEIRQSVDHIRGQAHSLDDLADKLHKEFGIETKIQNKNISFKHPDRQRFVRGKKLGLAYEKETLKHEFERRIERSPERGETGERTAGERGFDGQAENGGRVPVNPAERKHDEGNRDYRGTGRNQEGQPGRTRGHEIDLTKFDQQLAERQRGIQDAYRSQRQTASSTGHEGGKGVGNQPEHDRERAENHQRERTRQPERHREGDKGYDLER